MNKKIECHTRIKLAMDLRGMTQSEIVEKTNIKKSAMSQYLSGKITPRQNAIDELSKVLDVSEPWLMGYDVPMERKVKSKNKTPENQDIVSFFRIDTSDLTDVETQEIKDELERYTNILKAAIKSKREEK